MSNELLERSVYYSIGGGGTVQARTTYRVFKCPRTGEVFREQVEAVEFHGVPETAIPQLDAWAVRGMPWGDPPEFMR